VDSVVIANCVIKIINKQVEGKINRIRIKEQTKQGNKGTAKSGKQGRMQIYKSPIQLWDWPLVYLQV